MMKKEDGNDNGGKVLRLPWQCGEGWRDTDWQHTGGGSGPGQVPVHCQGQWPGNQGSDFYRGLRTLTSNLQSSHAFKTFAIPNVRL